ncbi:MAG TPA: tetratricopeptide repeat protein, partial [Pyrinomonadaceae bacterium]
MQGFVRRLRLGLLPCVVLAAGWHAAAPTAAGRQQQQQPVIDPREREEVRQLHGRATRLYAEGKYDEAVPLAERALAMMEKTLGPDHPGLLSVLKSLAVLHDARGDYPKAEPLHLRAVAISEKAFSPDHPQLAGSLNNLAAHYEARGDYARAESLYTRALAIYELDPERGELAATLNNLAALYFAKQDYARAEPLYLRALSISEKALGPDHLDVASSLNNLAALYDARGDFERAEPLYLRSLAATEKALGPDHPDVSTGLNNLAVMYDLRGDYRKAEPFYLRALSISEKALGPDHPDVAMSLSSIGSMYDAMGDYDRAVRFAARAQEARERNLALVLSAGSERQKLAYLATISGETFTAVSLHAKSAPSDPRALRLALITVLRRKGRALDALSDQVAALRRRLDPQDRKLLDRLSAAQSELSSLTLGGPGETSVADHRAAVSRLEAEVERLQDAVGRRSAEFRTQTRPVTVESVQRAIPAGAALVEFFSYRPVDAKARTQAVQLGPARYVAYVLRGEGEPLWVELGEAAAVNEAVSEFRAALDNPASKNYREAARVLDERVMRPVRKLTGEARHLFLSPDGALNLIPFAALVDEQGRYLVETHSLTFLTSGRDLLRLQVGSQSREPPLVIADPAFGDAGGQAALAAAGRA